MVQLCRTWGKPNDIQQSFCNEVVEALNLCEPQVRLNCRQNYSCHRELYVTSLCGTALTRLNATPVWYCGVTLLLEGVERLLWCLNLQAVSREKFKTPQHKDSTQLHRKHEPSACMSSSACVCQRGKDWKDERNNCREKRVISLKAEKESGKRGRGKRKGEMERKKEKCRKRFAILV